MKKTTTTSEEQRQKVSSLLAHDNQMIFMAEAEQHWPTIWVHLQGTFSEITITRIW